MKVIITGAGGYLGSRLVKIAAKKEDVQVAAVVRPGSDTVHLKGYAGKILCADLSQKKKTNGLLQGIDCVYHLAAATSGSHFEMMMNTVVATENLFAAMGESVIKRIVLVSSFSVYQMSSLRNGAKLDETCLVETKLNQRDPYTITKVRQEILVKQKCRELNIPLVIIRPGKIYGPGDNPIPPQLGLNIPGICFLYIGGQNLIPLTHVTNCAQAIFNAGVAKGIEGESFNIVDDNLPTQKEFVRRYETMIGKIPRKVWLPLPLFKLMAIFFEYASMKTKGNIPPIITRYRGANLWGNYKYPNTKAKKLLNWQPRISIHDGLKEMFESYKSAWNL